MNTQLNKAIELAGGVNKLARALGITHSNISQWRTSTVPYKQRIAIEKLTRGQIRAVDWEDA